MCLYFQEAIAVFEEALRKRPDHYGPQSIYNLYGNDVFKMNWCDF